MFQRFTSSFGYGALAYFFAGLWVNWGGLAPTIHSKNIGYLLGAIGLTFWILSFILQSIETWKGLDDHQWFKINPKK